MKEVLVIKSEKITKIICQYHILPLFLQIYIIGYTGMGKLGPHMQTVQWFPLGIGTSEGDAFVLF